RPTRLRARTGNLGSWSRSPEGRGAGATREERRGGRTRTRLPSPAWLAPSESWRRTPWTRRLARAARIRPHTGAGEASVPRSPPRGGDRGTEASPAPVCGRILAALARRRVHGVLLHDSDGASQAGEGRRVLVRPPLRSSRVAPAPRPSGLRLQ